MTASSSSKSTPPVADRIPERRELHGDVRVDEYAWLRKRDAPETLAYLRAENAYTEAILRPTETRQRAIYEQMLARIKQTDHSAPYRHGPFLYYRRTEQGKSYGILCRRPHDAGPPGDDPDADEQVLLDENELAKGHAYFNLGGYDLSPDHQRLAYLVDTVGDERYTLKVKELTTGALHAEHIEQLANDVAWAADGRTLLYLRVDEANRPYQLMRHVLGTPSEQDVLVLHEPDDALFVSLSRTRSRRWFVVHIGSQITHEVRLLPTDAPEAPLKVVAPRHLGVEYFVEHHGDNLFILSNEDAINFRLWRAPLSDLSRSQWVEWIPHRDDVKLEDVDAFSGHLVISQRERGLPVLVVENLANGQRHRIEQPEPAHDVWIGTNVEFDTTTLRFTYTSMVTPHSVFDYDMNTRQRTLRKRTEVRNYVAENYQTERLMARAPDGTEVPISLVHKRGLARDGSHPMLLTGYGAYGFSYDPGFSSTRLSLLERGVIFAVAHVRGGGELGRPWYEAGRRLHKTNTFSDFIACADHLVNQGYASPARLAIYGGSAGGLLVGAVVNARPDLFGTAVADVPFVDVLNTMLDPSLPLTVTEYDEWGNPQKREFYEAIKAYSPYDNIKAQSYPAMLVLAGLSDARVGYWEPAKWVARLRTTKTDRNTLLLRTNMDAGHGGASGRYDALKESALWYTFVLEQLAVPEPAG